MEMDHMDSPNVGPKKRRRQRSRNPLASFASFRNSFSSSHDEERNYALVPFRHRPIAKYEPILPLLRAYLKEAYSPSLLEPIVSEGGAGAAEGAGGLAPTSVIPNGASMVWTATERDSALKYASEVDVDLERFLKRLRDHPWDQRKWGRRID